MHRRMRIVKKEAYEAEYACTLRACAVTTEWVRMIETQTIIHWKIVSHHKQRRKVKDIKKHGCYENVKWL